jgi:hypothetical protein
MYDAWYVMYCYNLKQKVLNDVSAWWVLLPFWIIFGLIHVMSLINSCITGCACVLREFTGAALQCVEAVFPKGLAHLSGKLAEGAPDSLSPLVFSSLLHLIFSVSLRVVPLCSIHGGDIDPNGVRSSKYAR